MSDLSRYFFKSLPIYFWEMDSYKDENGKGFVQRFTEVFQEEAELSYDNIKLLPQAIDPDLVKDSHLYLLGSIFGDPPTLFLDKLNYRKLLKYLPNLLKRKGTLSALIDIWKIIGIDAEIEDVTPPKAYYDNNLLFDKGGKFDSYCDSCFFFNLILYDLNNILGIEDQIPQNILDEIIWITYYVTPINGFLNSVIYNDIGSGFLLQEDGIPLKTSEEKLLKIKYQ